MEPDDQNKPEDRTLDREDRDERTPDVSKK